MNTTPTGPADAPVPAEGTEQAVGQAAEQAADQAAKQQQPPPPETSALDTVASVVDGVVDVASVAADIFSIFE